ncbi:hypothetical protein [Carnobacterium maltaromaticum]|uniref:hypothetical protein n=1 Tax=Carnobacterium maltaromaticum TaxID=2751 RepID=UPI0007049905|nr:hypothetical protein [Carnobacterium maltaromaticum]
MKLGKIILWFISILVAVCMTLLIVYLDKGKSVIGKDMLEMKISILTDIVGIFLAAILAYYTAYIQLNNEKKRSEKEKNIRILNKVTILLDEVDSNKKYIGLAKGKEGIDVGLTVSNFSVKEWENLKLEIEFNENEFKEINSLYRFYYLLDKIENPELERLDAIYLKLETASSMLKSKMDDLKKLNK